jgi:hypothetical protein
MRDLRHFSAETFGALLASQKKNKKERLFFCLFFFGLLSFTGKVLRKLGKASAISAIP